MRHVEGEPLARCIDSSKELASADPEVRSVVLPGSPAYERRSGDEITGRAAPDVTSSRALS
jgi:hypothetical protein